MLENCKTFTLVDQHFNTYSHTGAIFLEQHIGGELTSSGELFSHLLCGRKLAALEFLLLLLFFGGLKNPGERYDVSQVVKARRIGH